MKPSSRATTRELLQGADDSLLDLVDNLLNRGVVISGEVFLGLAGVDLIYLRVTALLCAADRLNPPDDR
jgi:Gas vesicle protein